MFFQFFLKFQNTIVFIKPIELLKPHDESQTKASPESIVRDIKRKARRKFTAKEKIIRDSDWYVILEPRFPPNPIPKLQEFPQKLI